MKTHGEVKCINGKRVASPEYRAWQAMKTRCLNPKAKDYKYYGGRGIKICTAWLEFDAFLEDIGRKPAPKLTLDRLDSDGDYTPDNCHWASRLHQSRNRKYAATKAWILAEQLGIKYMTANHIIWQVRNKDRGKTKWFALSPSLEYKVRVFLAENGVSL